MNRELLNLYISVPKQFIIASNTQDDNFINAMRQQTNEEPNSLYIKTRKYNKRSIAGDILDSAEVRAHLEAYLALDRL